MMVPVMGTPMVIIILGWLSLRRIARGVLGACSECAWCNEERRRDGSSNRVLGDDRAVIW